MSRGVFSCLVKREKRAKLLKLLISILLWGISYFLSADFVYNSAHLLLKPFLAFVGHVDHDLCVLQREKEKSKLKRIQRILLAIPTIFFRYLTFDGLRDNFFHPDHLLQLFLRLHPVLPVTIISGKFDLIYPILTYSQHKYHDMSVRFWFPQNRSQHIFLRQHLGAHIVTQFLRYFKRSCS